MTTPDMSAFGKYIPGFDFLQNLTRQAAGSVAPGAQSGVSGMPPLSQWVAPTFSVEDLEKRIQELRAVQFWLDQNAKALGATVQALEVQKMTLSALRGMNVKLQDVAEAFKVRPTFAAAEAPAPAPAPAAAAPAPAEAPASDEPESAKPAVDPMQWWGALTQQFQTIASGAIKDMAGHAAKAAEHVTQTVQATAQAATAKPAAKAGGNGADAKARRSAAAPAASAKTAKPKAAGARASAKPTASAAAPRSRKGAGG